MSIMRAAQPRQAAGVRRPSAGPQHLTLLELVETVGEFAQDDREVVATVLHMLATGKVTLCGSFRDEPITDFRD